MVPQEESNLHLRIRNPPFYPLNYEGEFDFFLDYEYFNKKMSKINKENINRKLKTEYLFCISKDFYKFFNRYIFWTSFWVNITFF